jgi:hypothetical protein
MYVYIVCVLYTYIYTCHCQVYFAVDSVARAGGQRGIVGVGGGNRGLGVLGVFGFKVSNTLATREQHTWVCLD